MSQAKPSVKCSLVQKSRFAPVQHMFSWAQSQASSHKTRNQKSNQRSNTQGRGGQKQG
jgi:hypothetical protein